VGAQELEPDCLCSILLASNDAQMSLNTPLIRPGKSPSF
jgi:hypothetical protein